MFTCNFYIGLSFYVILITFVRATVLKEALEEHLKDVAQNEGAVSVNKDQRKGEKLHHLDSEINDSHKTQLSKANDEANYLLKDRDTKSASEADAYKGYNSKQDKAEDSETTGFKRGHKKGHHKQGYQNSYHKDESSNKSTFFDDFNDEGDQAAYKGRLNSHDNQGGRTYQGSHNNGQEHARDNYHRGGHNRYGDNGNKYYGHRDYGKDYHSDDNLNYNKYQNDRNIHNRGNARDFHEYRAPQVHYDPGWDRQRWDERRHWDRPGWQRESGWEKDYGGPGYYDNHGLRHDGGYGHAYGYDESRETPIAEIPKNGPFVAHRKQTITIYEDPRYDGKNTGQLKREEGDYVQLEFKPSSHRYATYDNTYYNIPRRERGVEASKVNRLVYNYRRH